MSNQQLTYIVEDRQSALHNFFKLLTDDVLMNKSLIPTKNTLKKSEFKNAELLVYLGSSCKNSSDPKIGGLSIVVLDKNYNLHFHKSGYSHTCCERMKLFALIYALKHLSRSHSIRVLVDSTDLIHSYHNLRNIEKRRYNKKRNVDLLRKLPQFKQEFGHNIKLIYNKNLAADPLYQIAHDLAHYNRWYKHVCEVDHLYNNNNSVKNHKEDVKNPLLRDFRPLKKADLNNQALYPNRKILERLNFRNNDLIVYTDGSWLNKNSDKKIGGFAIIVVTKERDLLFYNSGFYNTTNQRMELSAILFVLRRLVPAYSIHIFTDYKKISDSNKQLLEQWADTDFENRADADLLRKIYTIRHQYRNKITITWVRGHSGNPLNEMADDIADAHRFPEDKLKLDINYLK